MQLKLDAYLRTLLLQRPQQVFRVSDQVLESFAGFAACHEPAMANYQVEQLSGLCLQGSWWGMSQTAGLGGGTFAAKDNASTTVRDDRQHARPR